MQSNNDGFDIFGTNAIEVESHSRENQPKKVSNFYSPKAKDASDGIYTAKIRFLYNPVNPVDSIVHKIVYYLLDKESKGHYFDSPQSIGDWNGCQAGQLWRKLSKSDSALDKQNAEKLNKRDVYYSLVYIIDDKIKPEFNGKIMVFKYGIKLKAKLDKYLNPKPGKKKVDIFNFFTGRNMDLTITRQGNYNNYDDVEFEEEGTPIEIKGVAVEPTEAGRAILADFMKGAPVLEEFKYKPLTDDERVKLEQILNQFRSPGDSIGTITSSAKKATDVSPAANQKTPKPEISEATGTAKAENADEDLDSFLDNIGI